MMRQVLKFEGRPGECNPVCGNRESSMIPYAAVWAGTLTAVVIGYWLGVKRNR